MAGGMILGVAEVFSVAYLQSSLRDAFAFGLMMLVLIVRPRGLFRTGMGR
jgi:branched-chain amino acid transport system permease protein